MPAPPPSATSAPAPGHALVVRDLFAGYQQVPVVRELNLEVRPGEVVALLGPNGAGKTTTLETIAGLNRPISGTVELSGENIGGTPAHVLAHRGLALVPEGRALFPGLTVREHLRLAGGRNAGREEELLEMLPELQKCLGRKAGLLSGGEQQMLAVGRALVTRPRLLGEKIVAGRAADVGFVLGHEVDNTICCLDSDRAYVLAHGRIRIEGPAAELRERRELLAASYLGETAA